MTGHKSAVKGDRGLLKYQSVYIKKNDRKIHPHWIWYVDDLIFKSTFLVISESAKLKSMPFHHSSGKLRDRSFITSRGRGDDFGWVQFLNKPFLGGARFSLIRNVRVFKLYDTATAV